MSNGTDEEKLWREYEFCDKTAQRLESLIWKTAGIMGVGSIASLIVVSNHSEKCQPPDTIVGIIGLFIFITSSIWWVMARRWWSIQHACFIRMQHLEDRLGIHAVRYLRYMDTPSEIDDAGLTENQAKDLKQRTERGKLFAPHQRLGIQSVIWLLPLLILVSWGLYYGWLVSK